MSRRRSTSGGYIQLHDYDHHHPAISGPPRNPRDHHPAYLLPPRSSDDNNRPRSPFVPNPPRPNPSVPTIRRLPSRWKFSNPSDDTIHGAGNLRNRAFAAFQSAGSLRMPTFSPTSADPSALPIFKSMPIWVDS